MDAKTLKLSLLSPERRLVMDEEVTEVFLTGSEGQIEILPDHQNMVGSLEPGLIAYQSTDSKDSHIGGFVSAGFFELSNGCLTVMAENLELIEEIDIDRAKEAQKRAEKSLSGQDLTPDEFKKHQLKLYRAMVRQQVAAKHIHPM